MINENDVPLVALESMNITHFEEVEIINTLVKQLETQADNDKLSKILAQLLEHMMQHFSNEEKLMQDAHYPSLNMHKADHDKVLNQTRYTEMMWRNNKDPELLNEFLQEELIPWLDIHIKAMDTPLADFLI